MSFLKLELTKETTIEAWISDDSAEDVEFTITQNVLVGLVQIFKLYLERLKRDSLLRGTYTKFEFRENELDVAAIAQLNVDLTREEVLQKVKQLLTLLETAHK